METVIVLPTYNEANNIEELIKQIFSLHSTINIIVVDDNSPDGTGLIVDAMAAKDGRIKIIHRSGKFGLGSAYVEGFRKALTENYDLICEMDADFSHSPLYLQKLFEAATDADLVIGSRYVGGVRVDGWRFRRLLMSKLANMYVSYVTNIPLWDFTAGFRCYRRRVIESIDLSRIRSDGYAFQIEMTDFTYRKGFKIVEVPIIFRERVKGVSKISKKVVWEALWLTLRCHGSFHDMIRRFTYIFKDYTEFVDYKNFGQPDFRKTGSDNINSSGKST